MPWLCLTKFVLGCSEELTEIVKSAMIHGPYGELNDKSHAWIGTAAPNVIPVRSVRRPRWARIVIRYIVGVTMTIDNVPFTSKEKNGQIGRAHV